MKIRAISHIINSLLTVGYVFINHDHKKLGSRCTRGVLIGYDKNSPAYIVYFPESGKITRYRLVKFIKNVGVEQSTQTISEEIGLSERVGKEGKIPSTDVWEKEEECSKPEVVENLDVDVEVNEVNDEEEFENVSKINSQRERKPPEYYGANNSVHVNVNYCYRVSGVPQTFEEAMNSSKASGWAQAMKNELAALKENDTFELTPLPTGKNLVGGGGGMGICYKRGCPRL